MSSGSCHFIFVAMTASALAIQGSPALPAAAKTNNWTSPATGEELEVRVMEPKSSDPHRPLPVILYFENLATARVGTDSDEAILSDFLGDGYRVVTLDYGHHPKARVPFINRDLFAIRDDLLHHRFLAESNTDLEHVFIVPAGCRLRRDVVFYREAERTLAMDIIYPAHPARPVGALIEFSCDNQNRMGNGSLAICSDTILEGEATEGFAAAMADHPVEAPYRGIDPMPDCARKIKAAVRTLRAETAGLGLNGKIVPVGFSRGSGMALMLVTTMGHAEFEGFGENPELSSEVQGAVIMSGRFTYLESLPDDHMLPRYTKAWGDLANHRDVWRRAGALDYLEHPTVPLFLTINRTEGPDAQLQMSALRQRLAELGNDEIFLMDPEPRGHKVTLVPDILAAMNRYLKARLN